MEPIFTEKNYSIESYKNLGRYLLSEAYRINKELGSKGFKRVESTKDLVLEADIAISKCVKEIVQSCGVQAVLFTEEFGQ